MEPQLIIRSTGRALHFFRVSSDGAFLGSRILNVHQIRRGGSSTIFSAFCLCDFFGLRNSRRLSIDDELCGDFNRLIDHTEPCFRP